MFTLAKVPVPVDVTPPINPPDALITPEAVILPLSKLISDPPTIKPEQEMCPLALIILAVTGDWNTV